MTRDEALAAFDHFRAFEGAAIRTVQLRGVSLRDRVPDDWSVEVTQATGTDFMDLVEHARRGGYWLYSSALAGGLTVVTDAEHARHRVVGA